MKLIRLKLNTTFRSLAEGFEIYFLREWDYNRGFEFNPYCLAGRNGSGKSNLLEALAAIFYHLECMYLDYKPETFDYNEETNPNGFRADLSIPDAFELEYFIPINYLTPLKPPQTQGHQLPAHIRIIKTIGNRPEVYWANKADFKDDVYATLPLKDVRTCLPRFILGYSSGHNEILSLPFFKMRFIQFDEYRFFLTNDMSYASPESRMIYLDDQFSQAILLCHFLFPSEAVTKVFADKIGLQDIRRFRIIIRRHHYLARAAENTENPNGPASDRVELTANLLSLLDKLTKCSTTYYEDYSAYKDEEGHDLILDYWVTEATREAFRYHFGASVGGSEEQSKAASALNLFQTLQTLLTLNYYKVDDDTKKELYRSGSIYLNETIPMPASHERIMRFKHFEIVKDGVSDTLYSKGLSDGEHQLLHTIGLCLLFRHETCLFLLDEPETHLNPDWRASYISTLRAALEADDGTKNVMRDVLLTSHAPFIISDCQKENVLVFEKDDENKVTCKTADFQTFGASSSLITNEIYNRPETIGDYANERLKQMEARLEQPGQDPRQLAREIDHTLGDSIEKTLAINRVLRSSGAS